MNRPNWQFENVEGAKSCNKCGGNLESAFMRGLLKPATTTLAGTIRSPERGVGPVPRTGR